MADKVRTSNVFLTALVIVFGSACIALADEHSHYSQGEFDRANVLVIYEASSGFPGAPRIVVGLSSEGRLKISGAYGDTTAIRAAVRPDVALSFINDLLAIDFFGQPKEFRAERGELRPSKSGKLSMASERTIDADESRITLHVGLRSHSVVLRAPAYGAPPALVDWGRKLRMLVKEHASWVRF